MKHTLFQFYVLLALVAGVVGVTLIIRIGENGKVGLIGALIAGILGFCYFVQQQKLAETGLFEELFTGFNARYDALNDKLLRIRRSATLSDDDKSVLMDYFNLCGEEYLFFSLGYIFPQVWRAWCRGMRDYLSVPSIADLWREELKADSYYGLSEDLINKGAA